MPALRGLAGAILLGGCASASPREPAEPASPRAEAAGEAVVTVDPVASGEIRGELELGDERPRPVFVRLRGGPGVPALESRAGDAGRFFFGPVPPGRYELVVAGADGRGLWREPVTVGDGDSLELTIDVSDAP